MKTWVKINLAGVLLFIIIVILGVLTRDNLGSGFSNEKQSPVSQPDSPVKILLHGLEKDDEGNLFIKGIAQNMGTAKLNYTEINGEFYNKAGNMITKSFDKVMDLEANETWNFKILYNGMESYNVVSYNVSIGSFW
jgi:hypothetical protein